MIAKQEHRCKAEHIVTCHKPIHGPDGKDVSFPAKCRVCGKVYEEIYRRENGLWDPVEKHAVYPTKDGDLCQKSAS
jgi:hypothetical protein